VYSTPPLKNFIATGALSLHDRLMTVHGFNVVQGHRTCSDS
jgi:hypothetical protein